VGFDFTPHQGSKALILRAFPARHSHQNHYGFAVLDIEIDRLHNTYYSHIKTPYLANAPPKTSLVIRIKPTTPPHLFYT
jgi:hypothetical protein